MNFKMFRERLKYPHKTSGFVYLLQDPALIFSFRDIPSKFYFSKTLEGVLKTDIVSCLHNFLPEKFLRHLGERGYTDQDGIRLILYLIIRAYKPEVVVETGVAHGASSAFILCAMHENNLGHLYSIDLPPHDASIKSGGEGGVLEDGQKFHSAKNFPVGDLIPAFLKERWTYIYGDSKKELPSLLKRLDKISIFFHDSLHTYQHMLFEYETAWLHIIKDGLLLSHDILWNKAFLDFSRKVNSKPLIYYSLGVIRK